MKGRWSFAGNRSEVDVFEYYLTQLDVGSPTAYR